MLSGHNRVNAGKRAGLTRCSAIVRENLTYEDAMLIITETNRPDSAGHKGRNRRVPLQTKLLV